ncbi:AmmeMemoRadiSam system radical SAM enzyme [candidate division KSB1 bacterium]|nr:AmmeMemoRadiSam system radical SAM enzyme [candidate division KSB1 bacterium]
MKRALYFDELAGQRVQCRLCPHECKIAPNKYGICGVRQNIDGALYSLIYERAIAVHVDPIEKKPLFHVFPGSRSFSIATAGCNFTCQFCQNHSISQIKGGEDLRNLGRTIPAAVVAEQAAQSDCKTIACTYTEPTVFYEYCLDIARAAQQKDIKTVWVTNGFINEAPLQEIAPFLAAANVDLKAWDEAFYRKVVGGELKPVLDTLKRMKRLGIWLEVTTLMVPGYVDNEETMREIALFIKNELGAETPWHISRFYPQYRFTHMPPTSLEAVHRAREIGLETGLRYVYSGNVHGDVGEHTFCYNCGAKLIERYGFEIMANHVKEGKCAVCGATIDGLF